MTTRWFRALTLVSAACFVSLTACNAWAQTPEGDLPGDNLILKDAGIQMLKVAVPRAEGDSGATAAETLSKDMDVTGLFQVLDQTSFPSQLVS